jgi:hypothetical protein
MQIASQHAEAIGKCAGVRVKEGFLFDGIALHAANVSPGHVELTSLVESDFTNAGLSFGNWAAMSARETADPVALDWFVEIAFPDVLIQDFMEGGHRRNLCLYFRAASPGK